MALKLTFHGAARTVTGSCYLIETDAARVLVDCGMFQGAKTVRELNYRAFPFQPSQVHTLLLTHAHIDHTGLVPKLVKGGFEGRIFATEATADLCSVMLPDSGHIQESEVKNLNERNRRRGLPEVEPIYTVEDAEAALKRFEAVAYKTWTAVANGMRARWWNAGHLLGSASIEVEVERGKNKPLRLLFSGDVGPGHKMLQPDPEAPQDYDYVVCESTYGGRDRAERGEDKRRDLMAEEITAAAARKGALLIPSFAVERTQEIVTDVISLMDEGRVPKAPVFIDSPLASKATAIFAKHAKDLDHGEELARAFSSKLLRITESVEESKAIARFTGFHIIIAASGMCDAGRIRHHLKNHLWRAATTVLLAGFQAEGSLGSLLEKGERMVIIHGDEVQVRATIRRFEDYSGHADGPELEQWLKERLPIAAAVFLTHGEEEPMEALASAISGKVLAAEKVIRPRLDDVYDLSGAAPLRLEAESRPRISPESVAKLDWHNDLSKLVLDINDAVKAKADERQRAVLLRRLRAALAGEEPQAKAKGERMRGVEQD